MSEQKSIPDLGGNKVQYFEVGMLGVCEDCLEVQCRYNKGIGTKAG